MKNVTPRLVSPTMRKCLLKLTPLEYGKNDMNTFSVSLAETAQKNKWQNPIITQTRGPVNSFLSSASTGGLKNCYRILPNGLCVTTYITKLPIATVAASVINI